MALLHTATACAASDGGCAWRQELFSLVHTLNPELFPKWKDYAERYCDRKLIFVAGGRRSWDTRGASNLPELHGKLSTLMVR